MIDLSRDLTEARVLDEAEMTTVAGREQKEFYIYSAETLKILGASDSAVDVRKYEEGVLAGGHHQ